MQLPRFCSPAYRPINAVEACPVMSCQPSHMYRQELPVVDRNPHLVAKNH